MAGHTYFVAIDAGLGGGTTADAVWVHNRYKVLANRKAVLQTQKGFFDFLRTNGFDVVGKTGRERLFVRTPFGRREVDIFVRDSLGRLHGIESKSGAAVRTIQQIAKDAFINHHGAEFFGRQARKFNIDQQTLTSIIVAR